MNENILVSDVLKNRLDISNITLKESESKKYLIVRAISILENNIELELVIDDNWLLQKTYKIKNIMIKEKQYYFKNELEFKFKSFNNITMKEYKLPICKIVIEEEKFWKELSHV